MQKKVLVQTVPIRYGDAEIRAYKITENGIEKEGLKGSNFHTHKQYECHALLAGSLAVHTECGEISISAGEMLVIPPGVGHFAVKTEEAVLRYVFAFSLHRAESEMRGVYTFLKEALQKASFVPVSVPHGFISRIRAFAETDYAGVLGHVSAVAALGGIMEDLTAALSKEGFLSRADMEMTDARMLLDACINIPEMSLSDIAEVTAYSKRHLARIIREEYGASLSALRTRRRVKAAGKLLLETTDSIEQIALESGFSSANVMREMFKKYTGQTPRAYRKNKSRS